MVGLGAGFWFYGILVFFNVLNLYLTFYKNHPFHITRSLISDAKWEHLKVSNVPAKTEQPFFPSKCEISELEDE